jgi:putative ABC transport system permease protein
MAGSHSATASENLVALQVQPFAFIVVFTMIILKAMIQKSIIQTNSQANLAGLAIGMAVAILVALWVYNDVNDNHRLKNDLTDVYKRQTEPSEPKEQPSNGLQQSLAKVLHEKSGALDSLIKLAQLIENKVVDIFSLKILAVRTQLFDDPRAIIIPDTPVNDPFRSKAPFNYVVKLNHRMEVRVSGAFLTLLAPDGALED